MTIAIIFIVIYLVVNFVNSVVRSAGPVDDDQC